MRFLVILFPATDDAWAQRLRADLGMVGVEVVPAKEWGEVLKVAGRNRSGGLVLAGAVALRGLWNEDHGGFNFRPPARPGAAWHVTVVWPGQRADPTFVRRSREWGVGDHYGTDELLDRRTMERLLTRALLGAHGARIRTALLDRIEPERRAGVGPVVDAAVTGIICGERSVAALGRRVYLAESTLWRHMKGAGLTSPARFIQRVRVILAVLLRTDSASRERAWKTLGFGSPGHLSRRVRSHLGRSLRELDRGDMEHLLPELIEELLAKARASREDSGESGQD